MAFDLARGETVLFGGYEIALGNATAETWTFDGTTWTLETPSTVPPARDTHAMTYDSGRGVVVMFGGVDSGNFPSSINNETWEWNGVDWLQAAPATAPSARFGAAMAYDPLRGVTVLFGGSSGNSETWEYDGVTWTQASPVTTPPGRSNHAMAFDNGRGTVVMVGAAQGNVADSWEYDGTDWRPIASALLPPFRSGTAMAFDLARGATVLYGGRSGTTLRADTWELRGGEWHEFQLTTGAGATPRTNAAMVYDLLRSQIVLFGGANNGGDSGETWTFGGPAASYAVYGVGCASSAGVAQLRPTTLPVLGASFDLTVGPVPANSLVFVVWGFAGAANAPVPLAPAGCTQWVSPPLDSVSAFAASSPIAFSLPVPALPALAGTVANFQGAIFDPGTGIVVSDAGRAVLQ